VPELDIVTVQESDLRGITDPALLEWAASQRRIIITHDRATMSHYAYERVSAGLPMRGVFVVSDQVSVGRAIDSLVLMVLGSEADEWKDQVLFLPW
jgi:hypothetical protein